MHEAWRKLGAVSAWGPVLCAVGLCCLALGAWVHGWCGRPTILRRAEDEGTQAPSAWERISVHLVVFPLWALVFGAMVWRGVPGGMIDARFAFERHWPVWQQAEWIYLSVYFIPFFMPWLATSRKALRRFALNLWWLVLISAALFLLLPLGSPPRAFVPSSLPGKILAWETSRADFAAAALPSFHVFWALLCAGLLTTRGRGWAWAARVWAAAVVVACVANGAHALADVAASLVIFPLVAWERSPFRAMLRKAECWLPRG